MSCVRRIYRPSIPDGSMSAPVRVKLVEVGGQEILLVRFTTATQANQLGTSLRETVPAPRLTFDGEVHQIRGKSDVRTAINFLRERCTLIYAPNLLRSGMTARPNPWPISEEPPGPKAKPIVYMARVWHSDFAESLVFQLPRYDDDFMIELRRSVVPRAWKLYRKDFKVWIVADHYAPIAHDLLDSYYECWWDELLAGDEWNVLAPPRDTQYQIRSLTPQDFRTLGVSEGCAIWEIHEAYRDKKEAYKSQNLHADEWYDVDTAFHRMLLHYRTHDPDDDLPEQPAAPRALQEALGKAFESKRDQVLWYYKYQGSVNGIPKDVAMTEEGRKRVQRALELVIVWKARGDNNSSGE